MSNNIIIDLTEEPEDYNIEYVDLTIDDMEDNPYEDYMEDEMGNPYLQWINGVLDPEFLTSINHSPEEINELLDELDLTKMRFRNEEISEYEYETLCINLCERLATMRGDIA